MWTIAPKVLMIISNMSNQNLNLNINNKHVKIKENELGT